jgi:hypothetical protein
MSVFIEIHDEQKADEDIDTSCLSCTENVIGYVIAAVVRQTDGEISLERDIAVHADNAEDNQLAESVVKTIEAKLNEAFPDPNKPEPSKLWVPD